MKARQEAKAQATILEIVGDIPHADIAPPENVLFVCKLNPVTTDEDLEIIFGRFGKIIGYVVLKISIVCFTYCRYYENIVCVSKNEKYRK